jgi:nicotinamide-nucleotide amidase
MNAILIAIGNELTSGHILESNCAWLAQQLAQLGVGVRAHWTLADDRAATTHAIAHAADQADLVIVSGGIGPTADDLTRQALADAMDDTLMLDETALEQIEVFFAAHGWAMNETNRVQAMRPAGAELIENKLGTAPGLKATLAGATVYCLPGVPHEMKGMFERDIAPAIAPAGIIAHRTLRTCGMGESTLGELLHDLMTEQGDTLVNTTAQAGIISIRLRTRADDESAATATLDALAQTVYDRLGDIIYGEGDDTLPIAIGRYLRDAGQTVATAESCTGGLIGKMLTDASGASDYYPGGIVAYANEIKRDLLDVPQELLEAHGAVSPQVAGAMAIGAQKRFGSDWAISVTGIAGPGGGTEDKPVGLVYFGLAGPSGVTVHEENLQSTREYIRMRTAIIALNRLRAALMDAAE